MFEFEIIDNKLVAIFFPNFGIEEILKKIKKEGHCIKNTFWVEKNNLIENINTDEEYIAFAIGKKQNEIIKRITALKRDFSSYEAVKNQTKEFKSIAMHHFEDISHLLSDISEEDAEEFCNMYSSWYMVKKGVLLGRIIGQTLSAEQIPSCYVNAIRKAQEVSQNA